MDIWICSVCTFRDNSDDCQASTLYRFMQPPNPSGHSCLGGVFRTGVSFVGRFCGTLPGDVTLTLDWVSFMKYIITHKLKKPACHFEFASC